MSPTYSRLSKKKQRQLMRQTVVIIFAAIALLGAFLFFIMPQFVRLADGVLNGSSDLLDDQDVLPPQTPILAAPVAATNSATLSVRGAGEAGSQAILVVNGEKQAEVEIDEAGEFAFKVTLTEGENALAVYGVDAAGNESVKTQAYTVILDTLAPEIEIANPADGSTIELRKNQITTIQGTTEPMAKVFINERLVYAKADGSFSMSHQLAEGENMLKFKVVDKGGNESQKELRVKFRY